METLYKVLNDDGTCCHGGTGSWHLPVGKRPGKWMPRLNNVAACKRGYHVCQIDHLFDWFGPAIWIVETDGDLIRGGNKLVAPRARLVSRTAWSDRTARLFAADCAEHVLHLFEEKYPADMRPRNAIAAARQIANGEISAAAAYAAYAHAAAYAAHAHAAAYDAAVAAAAYDAAVAAAAYAAYAAYADIERKWQVERLRQYLHGEV